jgi:hypothetical protein
MGIKEIFRIILTGISLMLLIWVWYKVIKMIVITGMASCSCGV